MQVALSLGQCFQLPIRCHHFLIGMGLIALGFGVNNRDWEETEAVEVDIHIEEVSVELVEQFSAALADISISHPLAHHGPILRLHKAIVIAVSRPRPGETDQDLLSNQATV